MPVHIAATSRFISLNEHIVLHIQIGTHAQGASLASLGKDIDKNPRRRQALGAEAAGVSCHLKFVGTELAAGPQGQVRGLRFLIQPQWLL
jgi:hypothetical protein